MSKNEFDNTSSIIPFDEFYFIQLCLSISRQKPVTISLSSVCQFEKHRPNIYSLPNTCCNQNFHLNYNQNRKYVVWTKCTMSSGKIELATPMSNLGVKLDYSSCFNVVFVYWLNLRSTTL